jgi:hypothetical protein
MRILSIAVLTASTLMTSTWALSPSAFAASQSPPDVAVQSPNTPAVGRGIYDSAMPGTFTETNVTGYHPCPADVVFPNGHHACLGMP